MWFLTKNENLFMSNQPKDFVLKHREKLLQMAQDYLDEKVSHSEIREHVWSIIDDWEIHSDEIRKRKYIDGEKAFWAVVWSIETGADEIHWRDGCLQRSLPILIDCLRKMINLPNRYNARRPR